MEDVRLRVVVDKSQLSTLKKEVDNLNGKKVNLNEKGVKEYAEATKEATKQTHLLGDSFDKIVLKMAAWQVLGNAISKVIGSFREAVDTMKAVDSQLVVVRKVTGAAADELETLEKQAYKTASAYGVAADAYLESIAAFSRAGYKEQSAALAELSTKAQIVGDTSAETANQFLLSVDAAYKYKGNIEALSAVLDGANEIDNKYATSIEKIAEGLGAVAPVAAQAHVDIGELTAAIGTITAVTQRSGSEAARAFRALVLNILGDTKTEIDEGVTWTTGEIAGLRDVIKIYAKDAYEAAEATGKLINPMEAIGGLAQSMKDGLLTEQRLMEMVSDIGGKLRTSQLLALIQNWDMYQSMLADYGNAIGSADREVENALDSWERKTQILKNTWTEFISSLISTETIKSALDVVIDIVGAMSDWAGIIRSVADYIDDLNITVEEQRKIVQGLTSEIDSLRSEYEGLLSQSSWTAEEEAKLAILEKEIALKEKELSLERERLLLREWGPGTTRELRYGSEVATVSEGGESRRQSVALLEQYTRLQKARIDLQKQIRELDDDDIQGLNDLRASLNGVETQMNSAEKEMLSLYKNLSSFTKEEIAAADNGDELTEVMQRLEEALSITSNTTHAFTGATGKAYASAKEYVSALIEEEMQAGKTQAEIAGLIIKTIELNNTNLDVSQKLRALYQLANMAASAAAQITHLRLLQAAEAGDNRAGAALAARANRAISSEVNGYFSSSAIPDYGAAVSSSGGGSGGRSASNPEKEALEAEKKRMEAQRDQELAAIDDQIKALKDQHKAQKDANVLAEKQLAVEKALLDLETAQNERTVRYYNAQKDQWEWTANNKKISDAEQKLENARKALADAEAQKAYEDQLATLEAQKKDIKDFWKDTIDGLKAAIESIGDVNVNVNVSVPTAGGGQNTAQSSAKVEPKKESSYRPKGPGGGGGTGRLPTQLLYDSGGILQGLGGIKATTEDEMILPPSVTRRLLTPAKDSDFQRVISALNFITGKQPAAATAPIGVQDRVGSQYNGPIYYMGGITMTQEQAQKTTVADLARLSRNLTLYQKS